jgi:putative membrane protein
MISVSDLPTLNAALNTIAALLMVLGYRFIKRKNSGSHRLSMLGALGASALFLTSYLIYHYHIGSRSFVGGELSRLLYLTVLVSHIVLAMIVAPLVIVTVFLAFRQQFSWHRRFARWTFPLWLYVSVTGVVIYWMLYMQ